MVFNAAELTENGDLNIAGSLNTRLPVVTDGLICHYPFDGVVDNNLITQETITDDHPGQTKKWTINQPVWSGQVYTISTWVKRSSVHDGRIFCMFRLVDKDEIMIPGNSGLISGWSSMVNEPLYYYFHNDVKNYTTDYVLWQRDIKIPAGYDEGKIEWIQFAWAGTPYTTETTSIMLSHFGLKGARSYTPSTNSNTTLTYDGIAVEEATTNLIPNPEFLLGSSTPTSWIKEIVSGSPTGSWETGGLSGRSIKITSPTISDRIIWSTSVSDAYASQAYTLSGWVDRSDLANGHIQIQETKTGPSYQVHGASYTGEAQQDKDGCYWFKVSTSFTTASTFTGWSWGVRVDTAPNNGSNRATSFRACNIQLEKKSFATSFISGSRGIGSLAVPNCLGTTGGSINLKFKLTNLATTAYRMIISNQYNSNAFFITTTNSSNAVYGYYPNTSGSHTYLPISYSVEPLKWVTIAWVWDSSSIAVYVDGNKVGESTAGNIDCTRISTTIDKLYICGGNPSYPTPVGIVKDLSFYNRRLSVDEIGQLTNPAFELTPTGDLITSSITSKPNIPSDAIYFPLGHDAKDEYKVISPSSESNTVYEDGAVWVGQSTKNLANTTYISGWTNSGASVRTPNSKDIPPFYQGIPINKLEITSDGEGYIEVGSTVASVSTIYSAFVYAWIDVANNETSASVYLRQYWNSGNGSLGSLYYGSISDVRLMPQKQWIKLSLPNVTTRSDLETLTLRLCIYLHKSGSKIYLTAPQIEQRNFISPFVNGTRNNTNLVYPSDLIDFNAGTIYCWFYPTQGFFTTTVGDGWNRLFGHSTAVNANLIQISKVYSSNTLTFSITNSSSSPMGGGWTYCVSQALTAYSWYFVVARWDITSGKMAIFVNGVKNEKDWNSTYQPTVKGTFAVGYHDTYNSRWSNSYYKDLTIFKRALTDIEITNIYKEKMTVLNGTQIQGSIHTGQVIL